MPFDFGGQGGMSPHFSPQLPSWLRQNWGAQPQPTQGWMGAQPGGGAPATPGGGSYDAYGPWLSSFNPSNPGNANNQGVGQVQGLGNPYTNSNDLHTAPSLGVDALIAASKGGFFNPNQDPITELLRQQGFQDNAARQNAGQLSARLQGGGDPYLQGYAALQGQMGGESDLSRLLGQSQLSSLSNNQDFFRRLLMQMLGSNQGTIGADFLNRHQGQTNWGQVIGQLGGAAVGALGGGGLGGGGSNPYDPKNFVGPPAP